MIAAVSVPLKMMATIRLPMNESVETVREKKDNDPPELISRHIVKRTRNASTPDITMYVVGAAWLADICMSVVIMPAYTASIRPGNQTGLPNAMPPSRRLNSLTCAADSLPSSLRTVKNASTTSVSN